MKHKWVGAVVAAGLVAVAGAGWAQQPPVAPTPPPEKTAGEERLSQFNAGKKRVAGDPAQISRGKTLYAVNCRACHGADLRGGDIGGPNLLRSQVALSDENGEKIVPIIHGSRQKQGMPAIGINDADAMAAAAYVRSVIASIQSQGAPPSADRPPPSILVGNLQEGKAYFATNCASCHSATGDLKSIAAKYPDPKRLQRAWVAGGREDDDSAPSRMPTADVTLASGEKMSGQLEHLDDFLVTIRLSDGTVKSAERLGETNPQVVVHDPIERHRELWAKYTDKDIHDVTAYLETLK